MIAAALLFFGGAASADDVAPLSPGDSISRELRGETSHKYSIVTTDEVLIEVENLGRGTILTISTLTGDRIIRAANWREIEGRYKALVSSAAGLILEVSPDQAVAPPGRYRISILAAPTAEHAYRAELAMTAGSDLLLQHFFGESDSRSDALAEFQTAIDQFRQAGLQDRLADALFEAAGVYFNMGEHDEADDYYRRAEEIWLMLGDWRGVSSAQSLRGLIAWRTNRPGMAIDYFRQTVNRRRLLGDRFFHAQALNNLGLVYRDLNDARSAISLFEKALDGWQGSTELLNTDIDLVGFAEHEQPPWLFDSLVAINNLAWATELLGEHARSEQLLHKGLALSEHLSRERIGARIRSNLGRIRFKMGDLDSALQHLEVALHYYKTVAPDEVWAGNIHHSIAEVYVAAGDTVRAEYELREALRLRTAERDPVSRAETILALSELLLDSDRSESVAVGPSDALALLKDENLRLRARSHTLSARAHLRSGNSASALSSFNKALALYSEAGDLRAEAETRSYRARAIEILSGLEQSEAEWKIALRIARNVEDHLLELRILTRLAQAYVRREEYAQARLTAESALVLSEQVRREIHQPSLLRYFSSSQRDAYDVLVRSFVESGDVARAWRVSDQSRARRFRDQLGISSKSIAGWTPDERRKYQELVHKRAARAEELSGLLSSSKARESDDTQSQIATVRSELAGIVSSIDSLQRSNSGNISADQRPNFDLDSLQSLLVPEEVLLEFHVGEEHSGVWAITTDDLVYRQIVDAGALREDVLSVIDAIKRRNMTESMLTRISKRLFGENEMSLENATRVIVIPDGPLHLLPFAALPDPAQGFAAPMLERATISYSPSAAIFADLSRRKRSDSTGIMVLADPVFDASDPRVQEIVAEAKPNFAASLDPMLERGSISVERGAFPRLPGTLLESAAIAELAGEEAVHVATGHDATTDAVLSGQLAGYRVLHFATHGIVDAEEPSLSGLVLSGVSAEGEARSRFLRAQDVATLDLNADLVVLSGCDTGIGRLVRGEGVDGLTRAFFGAGAVQVVSSLWQVPDRATAALMREFYVGFLDQGLAPAEALRQAQLTIRSNGRWQQPYYWASFIAHGASSSHR